MDVISFFLTVIFLIGTTGILLLVSYAGTGRLSVAKLMLGIIAWALLMVSLAIGIKLSRQANTKTVVNTTSASVAGERSKIVDSGMTVTIDGVEYYLYQRGN